jgi:hypothetical protein
MRNLRAERTLRYVVDTMHCIARSTSPLGLRAYGGPWQAMDTASMHPRNVWIPIRAIRRIPFRTRIAGIA